MNPSPRAFPFTHADFTERVAVIDYETYYSSDYSVADLSYWHYCHHPEFDAYRVALVTSDGFKWVGRPEDAPWETVRGHVWVAHNKPFDYSVHLRLQELGKVPAWLPRFWGNSANLCAWIRAPRALAKAVDALYGITHGKDIRNKEMKGRRWAEFGAELQQRVDQYALRDSELALRLWLDHVRDWPLHEIRMADLIDLRGLRGLCVDQEGLERDMDLLKRAAHAALIRIPWHGNPDEKPLSGEACARECRKQGIPPPASLAMSDEGLQEWEDKYGDSHPFVGAMRDYRRMNMILKKYQTIQSRIKSDGRFEFSISYMGTHTGRTSGTDKGGNRAGANMLNLPRDPFYLRADLSVVHRKKELGAIAAHRRAHGGALPPGIAHAVDLRAKIVPGPGRKFVITDAAQIEARITNWVSGDKRTLALIRAGVGVYDAHAISLMGFKPRYDAAGKVVSLKKDNPQVYALAKARELGLGFQAGHIKFLAMAPLYIDEDAFAAIFYKEPAADEVTLYTEYLEATNQTQALKEFEAGDRYLQWTRIQSWLQVEQYRAAKKDTVCAMWRKMQKDLAASVEAGGCHEIELPSGRILRYFDPQRREKDIVARVERGGPFKYFYGGKLLENAVQSIAREYFVDRQLALDDAGIDVALDIYDEVLCETPVDFDERRVTAIMTTAPHWAAGLPLGAETEVSFHYKK